LLPGDFEADGFLGDQEGFLAADQRLAGAKLDRHDGAGEARRESDVAIAARGKIGDEQAAAGEAAGQAGKEAAAGVGVHLDRVVHPTHAVGLAIDGLVWHEVDRHGLHNGSGDRVLHGA
jgi:hypothetical protein